MTDQMPYIPNLPPEIVSDLPEGLSPEMAFEAWANGYVDGYHANTHVIFDTDGPAARVQSTYDKAYSRGEDDRETRRQLHERHGKPEAAPEQAKPEAEEEAAPARPIPERARDLLKTHGPTALFVTEKVMVTLASAAIVITALNQRERR